MALGTRPTQERSRGRRDALLRAAAELLAEGGARAVTHRAVAARAGMPAASTMYYFESIQQLTDEALRQHLTERVEELQRMIGKASGGGRTAEAIARRFARVLLERTNDIVVAQFEIYLEAARNPSLREHVAETLGAFEKLTESVLTTLGARRPADSAAAFLAMMDGFLLHHVARPRDFSRDAEALFEGLRALFIAAVMDEADLRERYRDLARPLRP